MTTATPDERVVVVGAGTVGAVLALELAHHGVRSILLERSTSPAGLRDLHALGGRSMELLRRLGLAEPIRERGVDPDSSTTVSWSQGLEQPPVLVSYGPSPNHLRLRYAEANDGTAPTEPPQWVSGARLAELLHDAIRSQPLIELRAGWTFTDLRIEVDGVAAGARHPVTGARHLLHGRFLAGCDGARSTVRQCLDIPMEDRRPPERYCSVYFRSTELSDRTPQSVLSTIVVGGVALVSRVDQDSWVGHLPIAPDEAIAADPVALMRSQLGVSLATPEVLGITQWDDSLAVAQEYGRGPAFLVGEAAHRFDPLGDTIDTSISDAVDLGWKLAAVLRGWGGPALLASYERERRPRALMARELVARALESRERFGRLAAAGASREFLAGVLRGELHQFDSSEVELGNRYASSPVVCPEPDASPGRLEQPTTPFARPGGRAPAIRLSDGSQLLDRFGPEFTLVDLTDDQSGRPLVTAACRRGVPMTHLPLGDAAVLARWGRRLALVRPDHHIVWHDGAPPADWDAILNVVTGH